MTARTINPSIALTGQARDPGLHSPDLASLVSETDSEKLEQKLRYFKWNFKKDTKNNENLIGLCFRRFRIYNNIEFTGIRYSLLLRFNVDTRIKITDLSGIRSEILRLINNGRLVCNSKNDGIGLAPEWLPGIGPCLQHDWIASPGSLVIPLWIYRKYLRPGVVHSEVLGKPSIGFSCAVCLSVMGDEAAFRFFTSYELGQAISFAAGLSATILEAQMEDEDYEA